ncbi:Tetratricopeptide repeat family protein [Borrelia nietonii YOR]|uniref:Tetratricopeptide repeat family protein n=1 Tax=Borrelia nietonii YOR TaxID=1293576 RepID=A0ABN4C434_9SPIR|nr:MULTISPECIES: tetratricopeptide repeat protein [Borrelia]AHH03715.1 Tetratricopeptide repeat family protein [Borrelia nietonii YOR]AHH14209.1 Tetratricopeptide repeat family protein [Borrelia hermsii MTW]UPA09394.1 tetratricopeptide repeat protein [Borrelia nietonii YOR]
MGINYLKCTFYLIISLSLLFFIFYFLSYFKTFSNSYLKAGPTEVNLLVLWDNKEYKEIIDYAENGLKENKFDFNLNLLLGFSYFYYSLMLNDSYLKNQFLDNAIERLRFLMSINDDVPMSSLYYILGKAYSHKGEYYSDLSVKYLNKALYSSSFDFMSVKDDIYEYLGYSYQLLKDYNSSLKFFEKAYKENKSDLVLWSLAYVNYRTGNIDKSVEYINKFFKSLHEDNESLKDKKSDDNLMQKVYLLYGDIYLEKDAYEDAFNCYDKVLKINSLNPNVYVKIGDIYRKRDKDYPKARKYWREALSINPYLEEARERLKISLEDF